jgi:capsid protein
VFFDEEGEQVTGYPKMTSALEPAADLREYDRSVLKAADNAAKHAVGLEVAHPEMVLDPDPLPAGDTLPISAGMANVAPMGWRFAPLTATQPMSVYGEFRSERLAELGRPIHMPLMLVLLSSRHSNFSSAQFDGSIYAEGVNDTQGMLELQHLNGCVEQVIVELVLTGLVSRPPEYSLTWSWPKPPHADIAKISKALRSQLEDGAISLVEYCAALGYDYEQVLANRERVASELAAMGLPPSPANTGGGQVSAAPPADDDEGPVESDEPQGDESSSDAERREGRYAQV